MTVVDVVGVDAERYLCGLLANDVRKLRSIADGKRRALYSCMLRDDGGNSRRG
jgi:glycine cleavage system aminomethyltransferase T